MIWLLILWRNRGIYIIASLTINARIQVVFQSALWTYTVKAFRVQGVGEPKLILHSSWVDETLAEECSLLGHFRRWEWTGSTRWLFRESRAIWRPRCIYQSRSMGGEFLLADIPRLNILLVLSNHSGSPHKSPFCQESVITWSLRHRSLGREGEWKQSFPFLTLLRFPIIT